MNQYSKLIYAIIGAVTGAIANGVLDLGEYSAVVTAVLVALAVYFAPANEEPLDGDDSIGYD